MSKLYTQTARKEYVCGKCHNTITKGEKYYKVKGMYVRTKIRCLNCRPERSEMTTSEYYSWLYDLQDHVEERYDLASEEGKDDLYSEIENVRDELQEKLDNIPEQLQYNQAGETLQERIDALDDALNELDNLYFPDEDDYAVDEDEYEDEDELEDAKQEKQDEYDEAVDEYKQSIIEIVDNIEWDKLC